MLGCHILNDKARNEKVGNFFKSNKKVSCIFGDTNLSTKPERSDVYGFKTIEKGRSVTSSSMHIASNSATDKMYDKIRHGSKIGYFGIH